MNISTTPPLRQRLTSRKLWLTVGAMVVFAIFPDATWEQIAGIVAAVTGYNISNALARRTSNEGS